MIPITYYRGPYSPRQALWHDGQGAACTLSETINCDFRPRLLLGQHGHLMYLTPQHVSSLLPHLLHFKAHGRLPCPGSTVTGDYEI